MEIDRSYVCEMILSHKMSWIFAISYNYDFYTYLWSFGQYNNLILREGNEKFRERERKMLLNDRGDETI